MWSLDVETGKATPLGSGLLNDNYQAWAPDSSALVFTAGPGRTALANKWLDLFNVSAGRTTTVVARTEQIPGMVAWSPRGNWIAYAAIAATDASTAPAEAVSLAAPAVARRRI